MNRYSCNVIEDLLPLYEDGCCSVDSRTIVEAHLSECSHCREALEEMHLPFGNMPSVADISPEQTAKKGLRRLRKLWLQSLSGAAAILIAVLVLFLAKQFLNRTYEVNHTSKCYLLEFTEDGSVFTNPTTFSIVGKGTSKRFSTTMGDFQGYMELAAYPIPTEVIMTSVSCKVYDELVSLPSTGIRMFHPEVGYWYWVFISPEDPDICVIIVSFLDSEAAVDRTITFVCGDNEEDAQENYTKYHEAFKSMTRE